MARPLTPQEEAVEAAVQAAKNGQLGNQQAPVPPEFNVAVNVNGEQVPYPLAILMVQNEQANALTRIAEVAEFFKAQAEKASNG